MAGKWHTRTGRISLSPHLPVGIPAWEICHLKCWYFSQAHSWDISTLLRYFLCIYAWSYHLPPYTDLYFLVKPILQFFWLLFFSVWQIHWNFLSKHFPQLHLSFHKPFSWMPDLAVWLLTLSTPSLLVKHLSPIQPHLQTEVMSTVEKTEM